MPKTNKKAYTYISPIELHARFKAAAEEYDGGRDSMSRIIVGLIGMWLNEQKPSPPAHVDDVEKGGIEL